MDLKKYIFNIFVKRGFGINILQWLISHKTQPNHKNGGDILTVFKQITVILNHLSYIAILKPINNLKTIELLVFHTNIWYHLTAYKQTSSGSFKNCYL